ncbi:histidine kinase [Seonamhaeicola sp.]|uniref:sensor histidine kinase n=1 Tax=Seonamhaeicola sp. TaxID=1912245 RepID=UPI002639F4E6|nr:histidine kinase [Seonamhaeicola sp.]
MLKRKLIFKVIGKILLHLVFWCAVLLFFIYFFRGGSKNFDDTLSFCLFLMPITIATTYVSIYKLIPDYLIKKKYFQFILYSIYTFIISGYLIMVSIFFSLIYIAKFEYNEMNPVTKNILFVATAVYLVVIIISGYKLLRLNITHTRQTGKLETKILETQLKLKEQELHYLKMQIHPHFLFNTLNTMYGFALKKANETPEMILKLSNLLDYLLYKVDKPFVLLSEDINHIKDYIELEKMRFNKTLNIDFTTKNISENIKIAPMLLLPFIENSFKHGAIKKGVLNIVSSLTCKDGYIHFYIENTCSEDETPKKGIGLTNIKKRLDLLYKDKYDLKIHHENGIFKVNLGLNTI